MARLEGGGARLGEVGLKGGMEMEDKRIGVRREKRAREVRRGSVAIATCCLMSAWYCLALRSAFFLRARRPADIYRQQGKARIGTHL